ncbi:MAG: ATP-dependent endonuclease [Candidatus Levybacteria bacterium]|nr:ATP-dependent endonuclease [Candidatus Levybacteria bacterium]
MKISKILLQNFKSFKSEAIDVPDIMAFIGENNAGKSNVLKALELFFSETKTLEQHFFNDAKQKMVVQIWFRDLNDDAKKTFRKYLLDDSETVIIRKEYFFEGEEKEKQKLFAVILGENFEDDKDKKDAIEILDKEDISPFVSPDKHYFWKPNPFGWRNVAASYLPDFLYVPAVKDIKEESKITEKSRFGQIINAMLGSVLQDEELKKVNEQFSKLLMGENETQDGRIAQLKEFETSLSEKLSAHMKGTTLKLEVTPPNIKEVFQSGTKIIVNDGVSTPIETKGHGMQRSVIFVIFRAYAELLKKEQEKAKALIFGIEEPELYLHPQMQRAMFALLKEIAKTDQVIFTTHSSFFVDMTDYKSICIAVKKDLETGTKVIQYQGEIFQEDEKKKQFRLITEFDPERNELFFGRKVILVEGDTEKVVLPLIAQKLKNDYVFYEHGFTVVECGSKDMIPFFARVLNKFRISYVVIHDKDNETDTSNKTIADEVAASGGIGLIEILDPKFETVCANAGVAIPTGGSKPFNAFKVFKELDQAMIPNRLKEIVEKIFEE